MPTHEIYRVAGILVREYGAEQAPLMAARRCEALLTIGDVGEMMIWKGVLRAVLEIVRAERKAGERMN
jgi:hypothetical protein